MTTGKKDTEHTWSTKDIVPRLEEELPDWFYEDGQLKRKYKTAGWKGTLMVINAIGHLAEVAWHHPDIEASYSFVIVKLMNHAANGITEKDFELAKKIEEVIMWKPGEDENSALDGTPDEDRYRYLR